MTPGPVSRLCRADVHYLEFDYCIRSIVSRSQTLYLPLPATRGGKGLAHTNIANGSELHRKAVEEIRPHSMNLIKYGTCQNDFCASETNVGLLPH